MSCRFCSKSQIENIKMEICEWKRNFISIIVPTMSLKIITITITITIIVITLQWCRNERDGVSNHQPHDCLLSCLFRHRSMKTSKLRVNGLYARNSSWPVNSPHNGPVTRKMFSFDDVIMIDIIISIYQLNLIQLNSLFGHLGLSGEDK